MVCSTDESNLELKFGLKCQEDILLVCNRVSAPLTTIHVEFDKIFYSLCDLHRIFSEFMFIVLYE